MKKILSFMILFLLLFNFITCAADSRSFEIYNVDMKNEYINSTKYLNYKFDLNRLNKEKIFKVKYEIEKRVKNITNKYKSISNEELSFTLIIGSVIALTIILIMFENKKQNEAIKKYRSEYLFHSSIKYIDAPSNTSPVLVNLLINGDNISREMLIYTLFYLCNLGYYTIEEVKYTERECNNKIGSDLIFKRDITKNSPREHHLNFIIELFFAYEINNEFSLMNIQRALIKKSEIRYFTSKLDEWKVEVIKDARELYFFKTIGKKEVLTNEAYYEKLKWLSYKEFIEKSINSNVNLIEIEKVNTVLVYAKALGINKLTSEELINAVISKSNLDKGLDDKYINNTNNYNYYLEYMNNMEYIYNIVASDD